MEEARKRAIQGGWANTFLKQMVTDSQALLDIDFWKALGITENWGDCISSYENAYTMKWDYHMIEFMKHQTAGKPVDEFFKKLLK